jgi:hypothetical protein
VLSEEIIEELDSRNKGDEGCKHKTKRKGRKHRR